MKKIFGYLAVALLSFGGGAVAGYFIRKKTTEVAFEEISEEEQAKQIAEDDPIQRPVDIQAAINRTFGLPDNYRDPENINPKPELSPEENNNLVQLDTQKMQYMKKWKAEEAADKNEGPRHAAADDEEDFESGMDHEFLNEVMQEDRDRGRPRTGADIEAATMEDWDHWLGIQDGDYDCVEVWWFDGDNVLTDEHGDPLENPGKFMGFDVAQKFEEISEDTTGDPDIRVIYNHHEGAIFQIIRKHGSYDRKKSMEEFGDDGEDEDEYERIHNRNE